MTLHLGNVPASSTLYIPFASYGKTNGESITLTGLAVTDIEIYKNGSTTQRASDAGYTLLDTDGIDFDGLTGIHGFSVDLSDNTDAGFYAVGSQYWVVVSSVTIDSQTVNFIAATFRIVAAEGVTGKPKVDVDAFGGTAGTFSGGRPEVNTTHWAGTAVGSTTVRADLINIAGAAVSTTTAQLGVNVVQISGDGTAADNLEAALDGTGGVTITAALTGAITGNITGNLSGSVGSVTGAVGSVTGNVGGNVVGSVASVTAEVSANMTKISGSATAADTLERSTEAICTGTCDTGGATTTVIASALSPASAVNDQFNGRIIIFDSDTTTAALRNQATDITDFVHATQTFTVTALTTAPASGDTFIIV